MQEQEKEQEEKSESKKVILQPIDSSLKKKPEKVVKEKSKRVITQSKKWDFTQEDLIIENQQKLLNQIENHQKKHENPKIHFLIQQINNKICGYKSQDLEKNLYMPTEFVDFAFVVHQLHKSPLCFYCREPVQLLYEFVREPKQWTLDRMDNALGHNRGNVEIACLRCNLRRRLMHHERFVFTKQLLIKKTT